MRRIFLGERKQHISSWRRQVSQVIITRFCPLVHRIIAVAGRHSSHDVWSPAVSNHPQALMQVSSVARQARPGTTAELVPSCLVELRSNCKSMPRPLHSPGPRECWRAVALILACLLACSLGPAITPSRLAGLLASVAVFAYSCKYILQRCAVELVE